MNDALAQLSFRLAYSSKTFEHFANDDGTRILASFDEGGSIRRLAIGADDAKHLPTLLLSRVVWFDGKVPDLSQASRDEPIKIGNFIVSFPPTAGLNATVNVVASKLDANDFSFDRDDIECVLRAAGLRTYAPQDDSSVLYFDSVSDPKFYTTECGVLHLATSPKGIGQVDVSRGVQNPTDADVAISALTCAVSNGTNGVSKNAADTKQMRCVEVARRAEYGPQLCAVLVFPNFIMNGAAEPAPDPMAPLSVQNARVGNAQPEPIPPPPPMHEDSQASTPSTADAEPDEAEAPAQE